MKAVDFIYDGIQLSDLGYMICRFDSAGGLETSTAGSTISFNTVQLRNGERHALASATYNEPFQATFQICKDAESSADTHITIDECSYIMKWLNRKEYHELTLIDWYEPEQNDIHYNGSFNVSRIEFGGVLVGFELEFHSNSPFGFGDQTSATLAFTGSNTQTLVVDSDVVGTLAPDLIEITLATSGDLTISNDMEQDSLYIGNCSAGEVITINCQTQIVESSYTQHKLYNDFNFHFPGIVCVMDGGANTFTASVPCTMTIKYTPVRKVVF